MAIDLTQQYPQQVDPSTAEYPLGRARNVTSIDDNNATPLDESWMNDHFGFQQALLAEAGVVPSGEPDRVGASDYLDAVKNIVGSRQINAGEVKTSINVVDAPERYQSEKNADVFNVKDIYKPDTLDYSPILEALGDLRRGAVVDLGGLTLPVSAIPEKVQVINGALSLSGELIAQPLTAKSHPLAGITGVILDDGVTHFWAHEMLHDIDTGKTLLFAKTAYRHGASLTAPLYMYTSEDNGLSIKSSKIIYNVRGSDIAEVRGGIMSNGRYGLLLSMRDTANVYTNDFLYSDDKGITWTAIKNVTTSPNFVYSDMLQSPNNFNTFYVYGYLGGLLRISKTTDNGLTWSSLSSDVGVGVTEPSIVKLPNQNNWIAFIRTAGNLFISTSTDMEVWTAAKDTGINLGSNPVQAIIENGKLYVYLYIRDFSETIAKQNTTLLMIDDYNYVYDNKDFSHSNLVPALTGIDRQLGYMRCCKTRMGNIFTINAGEYDGSTSYSAPSCVMLGGNYMSCSPSPNLPKPNYFRNGRFDFWNRGDTFTSGSNQKTADGWQTNHSGSTITASKYVVPTDISQSLPFRPKYGLKVVASADDYIGLFQIDYSDTALTSTQNQILTIQVWGMGAVPELELGYLQYFGATGSPGQTNSGFKLELSNVGTDKMWHGVGRIPVPTIDGKDIQAGAYFRLNIQSRVNAAWDCVFLGAHTAISNQLTPYSVCDYSPTPEAARCLEYLEVLDLPENVALSSGFALNETNVNSFIKYLKKVRTPTISLMGSLFFYPSAKDLTSVAFSSAYKDSAILTAGATGLVTGSVGIIRGRSSTGSKIIIDAE